MGNPGIADIVITIMPVIRRTTGYDTICVLRSMLRLFSDDALVTIIPVAVEISSDEI
ncbi:hypothetical protein SDC9_204380 [bioreactor metagenome]|uniref:Uncharacterized protein n=1 Tax=bioreactor metagenome TaxID=1076179 RepID=A0A645J1V9_9ZZZZ